MNDTILKGEGSCMYAIVTQDISFYNLEKNLIQIQVGTEVYIDRDEGVAFWSGYHFDISRDEYTTLQ